MMTTYSKRAIYLSVTAILCTATQGAVAHTRLETSTVVENTRIHNALNIGHGCSDPTGLKSGEGALKNQPTFGTSVVFPNAVSYSPIIGIDSGAGKVYSPKLATEFYSPLAGLGKLIRNGGPWEYQNNKVDEKGNVDGFWAGGKAYDQRIATSVQVDFFSAAIKIEPKSCARSVTFMLAVVDICNPAAQSPKIGDSDALFWSPIPNFEGVPGQPFGVGVADEARKIPAAAKFSNYDGWANGNAVGMGATNALAGDGWNSPASLKVTRNLETNPLPAGCTGNGGKGDDVYVYPSAAQINKELPIWSEANQTGTNYWQ